MSSPTTNLVNVIVIADSESLRAYSENIVEQLKKFNVGSVLRFGSVNKSVHSLINMLNRYNEGCYNNHNIKAYITVSDSYNDSVSLYSFINDYVSVPVLCGEHETAAFAAAKICALSDCRIKDEICKSQQDCRNSVHIADVQNKYEYYNTILNRLCENTTRVKPKGIDEGSGEGRSKGMGEGSGESGLVHKGNLIYSGKVRDIYAREDGNLDMIATNRLSAFDHHITNIPFKGEIINRISIWWLTQTKCIIPNHFVGLDHTNPRKMIVKKCRIYPIEVVVRDYLTGSTSTSIWTNYERGVRKYCGIDLPDGLHRNQKLPETLVTPTTKGKTDELIDDEYIIKNIMSKKQWDFLKGVALKLFRYGQETVAKNGLILVDTKYEFGVDDSGMMVLVDEIHTPDSSRFWIKHTYETNIAVGKEPENIDKEFLRRWLKTECEMRNINTTNGEMMSALVTPEMVKETSKKYMELYELITGNEFIF